MPYYVMLTYVAYILDNDIVDVVEVMPSKLDLISKHSCNIEGKTRSIEFNEY